MDCVMLKAEALRGDTGSQMADFKREILQICRDQLAAYKVPATVRFVPALKVVPAGKLARDDA